MNEKHILAIAALISAIAALFGVFWKKNDQPAPQPQPAAMAQQGGSNNIQLSGSGNTIQVSQQERERSIPTCEGYFPDLIDKSFDLYKTLSENPEKVIEYPEGARFYKCVSENKGRIIKLSVWLGDKRVNDAEEYLKREGKIYFHVGDYLTYSANPEYVSSGGGAEYLLEIGKESDAHFVAFPRRLTTISGLFKVSSMTGPFQGAMSVFLKGVRIEDAR
jgi:hypothetical protein